MNEARTVHERMVAILADLKPIGKTQKNQQQGFMFRGHDDVMNALNPLLSKHGVFVVPDVIERVPSQRTTAKGGVMFEVNLHVRFSFYGAAGDCVVGSAWGEGTDSGDKSTNKAMTMAFKNVLNQAFAINTQETIDADAHTPEDSVGSSAVASPQVSAAGDGGGGAAAPAATPPSYPKREQKLLELVKKKGDDGALERTKTSMEAARARGDATFDKWLREGTEHWEGQSEFQVPAGAR